MELEPGGQIFDQYCNLLTKQKGENTSGWFQFSFKEVECSAVPSINQQFSGWDLSKPNKETKTSGIESIFQTILTKSNTKKLVFLAKIHLISPDGCSQIDWSTYFYFFCSHMLDWSNATFPSWNVSKKEEPPRLPFVDVQQLVWEHIPDGEVAHWNFNLTWKTEKRKPKNNDLVFKFSSSWKRKHPLARINHLGLKNALFPTMY